MNNDRETALRSALPDDEHERLRGLIPEYIVARLRETPLSAAWGEFEAHLASCADCQNELEELSQLLSDTAAGNLPAATFYPELDMSYLSILSQSDPSDSSQVAPLSRLTTALERAARAVRQVAIQFTEDIVGAFRTPDLAGSFRGALHGSYQHPKQHPDDLHIAIDISPAGSDGVRCRVLVTVVDPKDPFAQEGHSVTLHYGTEAISEISDHRGCVAFEDIPSDAIPQLRFTIVPHTAGDGDT